MANVLEAAIERLTRALATASDGAVEDLVAERRAMRDELRTLHNRAAGNVVAIVDAPRAPRRR